MSLLIFNGTPTLLTDKALPVLDRSYLYGEGLFETFRSYKGKIPFLDAHLDRFYHGAKFLGLQAPPRQRIKAIVYALVKRQRTPDAYIKLVLSAQGSNIRLSKAQEASVNLAAYLEPFKRYSPELYRTGIAATLIESVRNDAPPLCWYKTTNYLTKVIARREVEKKGVWEGLLCNPEGFLSEGSISNLFWTANRTLYTPSLAAGCLPGVTRATFLRALRSAGIPCREVRALPQTLENADEILITNSLFEVLPVVTLDGQAVGKGKPGPLFKKMRRLYRRAIRLELEKLK